MLTWIEIKKSALKHNIKQFRRLVDRKVKIMTVVKSNAYGHGMIEVAKVALRSGADWLGVVNLDEALQLRQNKIKAPIFILSYWDISDLLVVKQAIKQNIDFPVYTKKQAQILSAVAKKNKKKVNIHIKIDTGASRIGIRPERAVNFVKQIQQNSHLNIRGIFTHYAASERKNQSYTNQQTKIFSDILANLRLLKINIPVIHAGCSASTIVNDLTHFNMIRLGIAMYGLWPSKETRIMAMKKKKKCILLPALTWKTKIIQVKELPAGTFIGYDCTYQIRRKTKIAVLPVGYWEGIDRKLSNYGEVLIHGQRCPIRGRVCMNLIMVEIAQAPNAQVDDEVVLIGRQGSKEITIEEMANKIGTINYEIITRINPLIFRKYV